MNRILRPTSNDGRQFDVIVDGNLIGKTYQAASGRWWVLPSRGGNLGNEATAANAAKALAKDAEIRPVRL